MHDEAARSRIDALIRRLDVDSAPDQAFVGSTFRMLSNHARAARTEDGTLLGRVRRDIRSLVATTARPFLPRPVVLLILMLVLVTLVAAVVASGAMERLHGIANGPLVVSIDGRLEAVDVASGAVRPLGDPGPRAIGVSRSPDGLLVAYWTDASDYSSDLHVRIIDGPSVRALMPRPRVRWVRGGIDTWSPDSRALASEVDVGGRSTILVTDIQSGASRFVGPTDVSVHAPLWSPDGRWIAFYQDTRPQASLAVMRPDGSGVRVISGDIGQFAAGGANNWAPDGASVYYIGRIGDAEGRLFRADVASGTSQPLTGDDLSAWAPALSPDGMNLSFIVVGDGVWDLWSAESDGARPHLVLPEATNLGWSTDSRDILAEWTPSVGLGGIALVQPDGTDVRVVLPFDAACQRSVKTCVTGIGWGQPRP